MTGGGTRARLVLFDALGTLFKPRIPVGLQPTPQNAAALSRAQPFYGASTAASDAKTLEPLDSNVSATRRWWKSVVLGTFLDAGLPKSELRKAEDALFAELWNSFACATGYAAYDETVVALERLRHGPLTPPKLGVLSNVDLRLHTALASLGIAQYFDVILCSEELACEKPDPRAFAAAAAAAGVLPQDVLHIGDDIHRDYMGARAAGMQSLWLQRSFQEESPLPPEVAPQDVIHSLLDVEKHWAYQDA
ncbi:HAD-like domain-containing protein [Thamnocephalis sphaerospora]|uniref:HAD-like domain-containing protein n=1 Tax=Thamnocephalis sphaerospora TaxID=78915 RepID=A0A4P9XTX5_9FUNG|nr:HAD-like domain-containing protein [Thamnocephalis sphaerospora]|eukprot:RKP09643.1 HAD-like domain-containing protein [Thamnocephalis sphaerospora]